MLNRSSDSRIYGTTEDMYVSVHKTLADTLTGTTTELCEQYVPVQNNSARGDAMMTLARWTHCVLIQMSRW